MAEPKKKLSRTRTHLRRSKYAVESASVTRCSHCGEVTLPHNVCRSCGYYRGAPVKPERPKERIVVDSPK